MSLSNFFWDEHCPRCGNAIHAFSDRVKGERNLRSCQNCGLRVMARINKNRQSHFFMYAIVYGIAILLLPNIVSAFLAFVFFGLSSYKLFQWEKKQ